MCASSARCGCTFCRRGSTSLILRWKKHAAPPERHPTRKGKPEVFREQYTQGIVSQSSVPHHSALAPPPPRPRAEVVQAEGAKRYAHPQGGRAIIPRLQLRGEARSKKRAKVGQYIHFCAPSAMRFHEEAQECSLPVRELRASESLHAESRPRSRHTRLRLS